ncbi:MAG: NAD(P)/FAD-dependent oxidoreductase [Planctomycetales bacterium]|nr:NAD(P)/FAD-dependent oxidoreductase [Planctomycetales bacterium]
MDRRRLLQVVGGVGAGIVGGLVPGALAREASAGPRPARKAPKPRPAAKSVVILGGGFGGITAALELRKAVAADRAAITLVDRKPRFLMGLRKLWIVAGVGNRADGERPLAALRARGVDVREAAVTAVDTGARAVRTEAGDLPYDFLVVALGAEPRPDLVPGFSEAAFNLYDPEQSEKLGARVASLSRGRVVIGVAGVPYKCPPAPYECAMLLDEAFRKRGVRDAIEIRTFTVQPMSLPVLGRKRCDEFEGRLQAKGIAFEAKKKLVKLDGSRAVFEDGTLEADVLAIVPPHRPPAVVKASGLTGAGEWVAVDRGTLRAGPAGVYAIGDVTDIPLANKMSLPKAGIFAELEGKAVAAGIAAEILGKAAPTPFDGRGYCFVEHGAGQAAAVQGEFFAEGEPKVEFLAPTPEGYAKKVEFERERLKAWFG